MINPNLLYEELDFDDLELEIELKTKDCIYKSFYIFDQTIFYEMYEWIYKVKHVGDKWETLSYDRSKKIQDICDRISRDAWIFGNL